MSDWPYEDRVHVKRAPELSWQCPEEMCTCHPPIDPQPFEHAVMLCDEHGVRMPGARCRVIVGGHEINHEHPNADGSGWLSFTVYRELTTALLEWAPGSLPQDERYPYRLVYNLQIGEGREASRRRLSNLGFVGGTLRDNVEAFQRQYGLKPVTGELGDIEEELHSFHDEARLPPVPADQAPDVVVPAAPPPPPPPSEGHGKLGDGQPPGQGTARSDMVARDLRLLDFDRNPATDADCQVQIANWLHETKADEDGVARFRAPRGAATCLANWQLDGAKYERADIELLAHREPDTFERLGNLGFSQATLEQRVIAYQREMEQTVTGREEDVAQEVKEWHDGGPRPGPKPQEQQSQQSQLAGGDVQLAAFIPPQIPHPLPKHFFKFLSTVGPVISGPIGPFLVVKPPGYKQTGSFATHFATFRTKLPKAALSITELSDKNRPYFGALDDQVHFSASTCKAIALFTASLLLSALRRYAKAVGLTVPAKKLLGKAAADFRAPILNEARKHSSLKPASDRDLLPNYKAAFTVTAAPAKAKKGSHKVNFSKNMLTAIDEMMKLSSNNHSATVIHNVGFGYIHGALTHAGLFDTSTDTGLWLAGDYTATRKARRIPAVNDKDTAQGATTRTFVALLDIALEKSFPNTTFVADKFAASRPGNPTWLTDPNRFTTRKKKGFIDVRGKIGDGQLKGSQGGHFVFSEVLEVRHEATGRRFLISYQNARDPETFDVSDIVFDGLTSYIKATP